MVHFMDWHSGLEHKDGQSFFSARQHFGSISKTLLVILFRKTKFRIFLDITARISNNYENKLGRYTIYDAI